MKIRNLRMPVRMEVVQGPLKPLEVGQYHYRQPKFVQIQRVKENSFLKINIKNIVLRNVQIEFMK